MRPRSKRARCTANGSGVEPISEIELELKSGNPAVLFDVALRLLEAAPVRIETRSRAERGYRLLGAASLPQALHAGPVALYPAMAVEAALQRFGRQCLTHLLRNEPSRSRVSRKASTKCEWPCDGFVQCFPR